jgi:hypothetical protein
VFAFLALAAIAKFGNDGDYPSKKQKTLPRVKTHNP